MYLDEGISLAISWTSYRFGQKTTLGFGISLFGLFSIFSVSLRPVLSVQKYNAYDEEKYSAD